MIESLQEFSERVSELIGIDLRGEVNPYDSLYEQWGLDSLLAFQLVVVIEALAELDVPPEEIPEMFTVADAYEYYLAAVAMAEA